MNELETRASTLVKEVKKGDKTAEKELFELTSGLLLGWLRGKLRSAQRAPRGEDADDLILQVMRKIFRAIQRGKYQDQGHYKAYAFRVANNVLIDHLRKLSGKKYLYLDDDAAADGERPSPEMEDASMDPASSLIERELLNLILEQVPKEDNEDAGAVFVGRGVIGMGSNVLAEAIGMNDQTVKSHYKRAVEGILEGLRRDPDLAGMSLEGLRTFISQKLTLKDEDLKALSAAHAKILKEAWKPGSRLAAVARAMDVTEAAASKLLKRALSELSKTRMRRPVAKPAADASGERLWSAVEAALAAYPEFLPVTRAESQGEEEALCEIFIHLTGALLGRDPRPPLGTLLAEALGPRSAKEAAAELGVPFTTVAALLSNSLPPHKLDAKLVAGLAKLCGCGAAEVQAAARRFTPPDGATRSADAGRLWERFRLTRA